MVILFCPLLQEDIIKEIENFKIDGEKVFSFKRNDGIKMIFESNIDDIYEETKLFKKTMKGYKYEKGLFYHVAPFDGKEIKWK